ncbi:MAG: O-antigen ligase family protein [Chloracidobacterium sp.]|nr:O-antigen ligase family protein [Chloracidobacterium sp.]
MIELLDRTERSPNNDKSTLQDSGRIFGLLSVILVAVLFRLLRPTIQVNLPYKVELLLAIFTICLLVYWRLTGVTREQIFRPVSGNLRLIMLTICGFIVWSGMSAFWSSSIDAAIQHTLLWSLYLVLFVLFTAIIRLENGVRTLVSTFGFAAIILGTLCLFEYVLLTDFASNEGNLRIRYGKYAEMLVTLLPILWAAAAYSRRRGQRLWLLLAAVLGWETAMLSLSKGAFIAGIAGTALFFIGGIFFSSTAFRKRILVLAGVWVAITIGTQVLFSAFTAMPSTTDYITGAADSTRSTSDMRIYTWSVGRQMASDSWLLGVGADNFGLVFNDARAKLRDLQPDEPKSEIGEDFLTERAHNEPLQVLAELGVIGFTLFVLPFLLFLVFVLRKFGRDGWKLSPMLWATLGSNLAFAISSMVSSFSFRAAQNGVVFLSFCNRDERTPSPRPLGDKRHQFRAGIPFKLGCSHITRSVLPNKRLRRVSGISGRMDGIAVRRSRPIPCRPRCRFRIFRCIPFKRRPLCFQR